MNELLNESEAKGLGEAIGRFNVSLISSCDDLIILSLLTSYVNQILKLCENYANKWKLVLKVTNYVIGIYMEEL
jgi:hypothetical protein